MNQRGFALIETLAALAILGIVAIAVLSGLATSSKATMINEKRAIAENLVRTEIEYFKNYAYQVDATEYPVDPSLTIPANWSLPNPTVEPVHATDDGLQEVTVSAVYNGSTVLSLIVYKANR